MNGRHSYIPGTRQQALIGGSPVADERELFSQFKPTWWDFVSARAWAKTVGAWQLDVEPILVTVSIFVVSAVVELVTDWDIGAANVMSSAKHAIGWIVVFWAWHLRNVVMAAIAIHNEQQATIADLETTLARQPRVSAALTAAGAGAFVAVGEAISVPPGHLALTGHAPSVVIAAPSLADRLIQFRIDGVKLRNEQVDATAFDAWKGRVDQWKSEVGDTVKGQINLADVARFITLDRVPVMDFKWACDKKHTKALRELSQRIQILLEIMAKL